MRLRVPPNVSDNEVIGRLGGQTSVDRCAVAVKMSATPAESTKALAERFRDARRLLEELWRKVLKKNTRQYAR